MRIDLTEATFIIPIRIESSDRLRNVITTTAFLLENFDTNITIKEVAKFTRNEMGGDLSEEVMRNGWTLSECMGVKWVITIKKGIVPTNTMYHFADPKFIGKSYMLEDTTMYIRREAYFIEFFEIGRAHV